MADRRIYEHHVDCLKLFDKLTGTIGLSAGKSSNMSTADEIQEEFDKYKVWAGNTGAAMGEHWQLSLDFRLQEAGFLKDQARSLSLRVERSKH